MTSDNHGNNNGEVWSRWSTNKFVRNREEYEKYFLQKYYECLSNTGDAALRDDISRLEELERQYPEIANAIVEEMQFKEIASEESGEIFMYLGELTGRDRQTCKIILANLSPTKEHRMTEYVKVITQAMILCLEKRVEDPDHEFKFEELRSRLSE